MERSPQPSRWMGLLVVARRLGGIADGRVGRRVSHRGGHLGNAGAALGRGALEARSHPQPPGTWRQLSDVSAIGRDDAWAVGDTNSLAALIMHWDGITWKLIPSPPLDNGFRRLYSVSAVASDDVWAAGWQLVSGRAPRTLIEHWDGTTWRIVPSPNVGAADNYLWDIDAAVPDEVWAVGEEFANSLPLVEHWDGARWTVVPGPDLYGYTGALRSVAAISPEDALAVGSRRDPEFREDPHPCGKLERVELGDDDRR
jgi:hypothetical protein